MATQQIETARRTRFTELLGNRKLSAVAYVIAIALAELVTTFGNPNFGIIFHASIAVAILLHWLVASQYGNSDIFVALLTAPLIRLLSLALPLFVIPLQYWYLVVSIPLYIAAFTIMRILNFPLRSLLTKRKDLLFQLGVGCTGVVFGIVEYSILHTKPIIDSPTVPNLLIGIVVMSVGTGIMEELVFRGILQRAAENSLGKFGGLLFASAIFTVLHIGWQSVIDLFFVFIVGFFWGVVFQRRGSIVGTSISHSVTNILLFLVLPFLFPAAPVVPHLLPEVAPTVAPIIHQLPEVVSTPVPEQVNPPYDAVLNRPTDALPFVQSPMDTSALNKQRDHFVEYAVIVIVAQIYLFLVWVSLMRVPIVRKLRRIKNRYGNGLTKV